MNTEYRSSKELVRETPLKKLDPALLSITLVHEAMDAGMDSAKIFDALSLAAHLHSGQTRANRGNLPRTPYIEHPLRNALRILRWGCTKESVVIAAILHDTVEDCAKKFAKDFMGRTDCDEPEAREFLLAYITEHYGAEVARVVLAVSNDFVEDSVSRSHSKEQKRGIYKRHVVGSIQDDPDVLLVKFSDFVDNATGLYHNDIPKNLERVFNLALKYLPLVPVFIKEIKAQEDSIAVDEVGIETMLQHAYATKERLEAIVSR